MAGIRGRDREWAQITHALTRVSRNHRTVLLIEGPPGSGKTRLLTELTAAARERHIVVLEHSGWTPAVGLTRVIAECQRLVSEAVAPGGPILVAWDDPPWSNTELVSLLREAMARLPLVWALTRPASAGPPGPLSGSDVLCVDVGPLTDDAVAELVADHLGAPASAELLALSAIAAGRPGSVIDLLDELREEDLIAVVQGEVRLTSPLLPHRSLAALRRQLGHLPGEARRLLQVASVLGPSCSPADLARLLRKNTAGLLPIVEQVLAAGLLRSGPDQLSFRHELVRDAVAESVPASLRSALRDEIDRPDATPSDVDEPGSARRPAATATGWSALTQTELRVAQLVRYAMTNQQVANRMRISRHTVNYHLRQIYRKLDINSRVQLAGLAQEHSPDPPAAA